MDDLVEVLMKFDLMPEYLLEVREHLDIISGGLLQLEGLVEGDTSRTEILRSLFRSFHTVKGLSAMAQQKEIEGLAHRCESLLSLRDTPRAIPAGEIEDILIAATRTMGESVQLLEEHGAAVTRDMLAIPKELKDRLEQLFILGKEGEVSETYNATAERGDLPGLPEHILRKLTKEDAALLRLGLEHGARMYIGQFSPTQDMLSEGISIATVLERIDSIGQLVRNIPTTSRRPAGEPGVRVTFTLVFLSDLPFGELVAHIGIPELQLSLVEKQHDTDSQDHEIPQTPMPEENRESPASTMEESLATQDDPASAVVIRIGLRKMDEIMRLTGELMITKSRLLSGLKRLEATGSERELAYALSEDGQRLERGLRTLREAILETRLVPIREAFHRLPLVLRDVMRGSGKKVRMVFEGEQIEIDRMIVERLVDPLIHIVRNAFDHGIESPEQRGLSGKDAVAMIHVGATRKGNHVLLHVRDDGAGIDVAKVAARTREMGFEVPADEALNMDDVLGCLCRPGFSTQSQASRISGRGVGMDVVAHNIAALNGILSLDSVPGEGTCFTMQIPITLSITDAMLVRAAGQTFAIPIGMVSETVALSPSDISQIERNRVARFREMAVPVVALHELYDLALPCDWEKERPALLTSFGKDSVLIPVDALIGKQELVVKAFKDPLIRVAGVIGATELGDGQVVLILDLPGILAQRWRDRHDN